MDNKISENRGEGVIVSNLSKTVGMFQRMLVNILAIILLSGLIMEFIPLNQMSEFLGGGVFIDGLIGGGVGSISIGNPLVSYVLGGSFSVKASVSWLLRP